MKTAICISGIGRSIQHTFDNLRDKLIGSFENPTVFVYVGKSKNSDIAIEMFNSFIF